MNKLECNKIVRLVYKYLKIQPILFKKLKGRVGYYNHENNEIGIDYRKDIISTLIHEVLHHYYPNLNETQIRTKESETINTISVKQAKNILKALVDSF